VRLEVDRGGESRVAVFSGQVKVRQGAAHEGNTFRTLSEGEAVRFSALAGLRRWEHVAMAAEAAGILSRASPAVGGAGPSVFALPRGRPEGPPPATPAAPAIAEPAAQAPAARTTGTVKFVLTPEDAEIRIGGAAVHTGSPWSTELPAGIHQIEIRKQGYKAWVTSLELSAAETQWMHVVLEPISDAVANTATLKITTTPSGLDVFIDGQPLPTKTPIETTLAAGPHKIAIKQNGAEVWQQTLTAEPQSDYEFNPSLDKPRPAPTRPAAVPPRTADAGVPVDAPPPVDAPIPAADASELEVP